MPRLQERGFRFYSPEIGRWQNRDPIGEKGGSSLFAFVKNSPVMLCDPIGETWDIVSDPEHPGEYKLTPRNDPHEVPRCEIHILAGHRTMMPSAIVVAPKNKDCATGAAYGCYTGGGVAEHLGKLIHTPPVPSPGIPGVPQPTAEVGDAALTELAQQAFAVAQKLADGYCMTCCCPEVRIVTQVLDILPRPDYPGDQLFRDAMAKLNKVIKCR